MSYKFVVTSNSLVVTGRGRVVTVTETQPNYLPLKRAIAEAKSVQDRGEEPDWTAVEEHLDVGKSIQTWSRGNFALARGKVLYKGEEVDGDISERISSMASRGEDVKPLLAFYEKLKANPSWRSVNQLYPFLKHQGIPMLENGNFLAYKGVNGNFTDKHTGTVDNKPGTVNEMPRNKISDDPKEACHFGFHVGDLSYAQGFGHTVVVCEVDPKDVVCIPYDCSQRKMRVCKYRVVGIHNGELLPSTTYELEAVGGSSEVEPVGDEEEATLEVEVKAPRERKIRGKRDSEARPKLKVAREFRKIHEADYRFLLEFSVIELRAYATHVLHVVGASKIVGGKVPLAKQIVKARKSFS